MPLGPSLLKEQGMAKLCVRLGQEHPKGVLQLVDTELDLAFWHNTDMMATTCCITAAKF